MSDHKHSGEGCCSTEKAGDTKTAAANTSKSAAKSAAKGESCDTMKPEDKAAKKGSCGC